MKEGVKPQATANGLEPLPTRTMIVVRLIGVTSSPATHSTAPCGFLVADVRLELTVFRV